MAILIPLVGKTWFCHGGISLTKNAHILISPKKYLSKYILFEDDDFVFVNKIAGLLSIADRYDHERPHVKGLLKQQYGEIFTLHRLDVNTSGIIIFAKNAEAHRTCSELFENRDIEKEYTALIMSAPFEEEGSIKEPISEKKSNRGTYVVNTSGKQAHTDYKIVKSWGSYSLMNLYPRTGRTHQIRVHLSYIGHPLMVDPDYGYTKEFFLSAIKKKKVNVKKGEKERPLLSRTPLHASRLTFTNPVSKKKYDVECVLPKDMKAIVYQLNKRFGEGEHERSH